MKNEIEQHVWGMTPEGEAIIIYTLRNGNGCEVQVCNLGAAMVSVKCPDREGHFADVILGYRDFASYYNDPACSGKSVGRVANRIAGGRMRVDGVPARQRRGPRRVPGRRPAEAGRGRACRIVIVEGIARVTWYNIKLSQNCPEVSQNSDTSGHCVSIGIALQPTVQSAAADAQFFCRAGGVAVALLERRKDGGTVPAAGESGCRGGGRRSDGAVRPGA